jgi:restriction system protein
VKNYYRIMLGRKSMYAKECVAEGYIGINFGLPQDLTHKRPDSWQAFNREFIPIYLAAHPDKTKVAAGLACGALWTVTKGINNGDIILSPDGEGSYFVGEVIQDYSYHPETNLPHRRGVQWLAQTLSRNDMSDSLRNSLGSIGTVSRINAHAGEIERLITSISAPTLTTSEPSIEDPIAFALEKHLEDFLVQNWAQTEIGKIYDIFQEDNELVGQQYPTDTGYIDILATSKDKKTLLVIELKKGRASDVVVGQILRYMSYVQDELAEDHQQVRGIIIALEDDQRIRRALKLVPTVEFFRYQINFRLIKA